MGLLNRFGLGKKRVTFSRGQALKARPIRNDLVQWARNEENEVQLSVPRAETRLAKFIERVFPVPRERELVLDEIGSQIWEHCDGKETVDSLIDLVRSRYKLNRREAEISVTQYLKTLAQRGLIGFQIEGIEGGQP